MKLYIERACNQNMYLSNMWLKQNLLKKLLCLIEDVIVIFFLHQNKVP